MYILIDVSFVPDSWRCGGQQCGEQGGGNRGREDEAGGGIKARAAIYSLKIGKLNC